MTSTVRRKTLSFRTMALAAIAFAVVAPSRAPAAEEAAEAQAVASKESQRVVDRFVGEHRFEGGAKERKARDAAIDAVVGDMNIFARGIARDRLKESTQIAERITIARDGDRLTITHDGRGYTATIDGPAVRAKSVTGDDVSLRHVVRGETIQQIFVGDQGGRTNTIRLTDDKMVMQVRVHSEKLPKDLTFTLSYSR